MSRVLALDSGPKSRVAAHYRCWGAEQRRYAGDGPTVGRIAGCNPGLPAGVLRDGSTFKVENGLITEEVGLDDGVSVLQQLGLITPA